MSHAINTLICTIEFVCDSIADSPPIHDVHPVALWLGYVFCHEQSVPRHIGSDGGDPSNGALGGRIPPGLVVGREDT